MNVLPTCKFDNSPIRCSIPISISRVDIILSTQDTSESNCVEHVFLEVFVGANAPELARIGRVGHCHRVHEVWNASWHWGLRAFTSKEGGDVTSRRMASRAFGVIVPASPNSTSAISSISSLAAWWRRRLIRIGKKPSLAIACKYYVWDVMISGKERCEAQVAKGNKKIYLY